MNKYEANYEPNWFEFCWIPNQVWVSRKYIRHSSRQPERSRRSSATRYLSATRARPKSTEREGEKGADTETKLELFQSEEDPRLDRNERMWERGVEWINWVKCERQSCISRQTDKQDQGLKCSWTGNTRQQNIWKRRQVQQLDQELEIIAHSLGMFHLRRALALVVSAGLWWCSISVANAGDHRISVVSGTLAATYGQYGVTISAGKSK